TRAGAQDLESVRSTVEFAIGNDLKVLLLTSGDSNYELQSEEEIRAVARAVIEQAAGRATVIVGTAYHWWHDQIVDFARYVVDLGADAIMPLRPQVALGNSPFNEDPTFEIYRAVSEAVDCGIVLNGVFSMNLLGRLAEIPNVVALKEDAGDAWCHDALYAVGKKLAVFNGGQKWRFLYGRLWGMAGYMTTYGLLAPQVTHEFWSAVLRKELFAAAKIVDTYDNPFFGFAIAHPKGFHSVLQAAMEVFGRGPRWLRAPQPSLDDQEMVTLRAVFEELGLL
ncbi:MAG: dihydrodipicolinate synthase family protein, partial [Candidatus Latescibacterota bacterium]